MLGCNLVSLYSVRQSINQSVKVVTWFVSMARARLKSPESPNALYDKSMDSICLPEM